MKKQQEKPSLFPPDIEAELQRLSLQQHPQLVKPAAQRLEVFKEHFSKKSEVKPEEKSPKRRPIPTILMVGGVASAGYNLLQGDWDGAVMGSAAALTGFGLSSLGRSIQSEDMVTNSQRLEAIDNYIRDFNRNNGLQEQA